MTRKQWLILLGVAMVVVTIIPLTRKMGMLAKLSRCSVGISRATRPNS
jgi:hypothetical protein